MPQMFEPGAPGWLLYKMLSWMESRRETLERYDDYYTGLHDLQLTSEKFAEAFGDQLAPIADNLTAMVVDAAEERLNVEGFRINVDSDGGDSNDGVRGDPVAWDIWQRNGLDAESQHGHVESMVCGESYAEVSIEDGQPVIEVHHADDTMVLHDPQHRRRRRAAVRLWRDDDDIQHARVYTPDRVFEFTRASRSAWEPVEGGEDGQRHGFDVVPIVPLVNRGRLRGAWSPRDGQTHTRLIDPSNPLRGPRNRRRQDDRWLAGGDSEIRQILPVQDAVNKVLGDAIILSEFAAYPQKYATGVQAPSRSEQVHMAVDRMVTSPESDTRFGAFPAATLDGHVRLIEMLVQHVSTQSRTPPHYFFLGGHFPSGESIRSAEAGLVAKVKRKQRQLGEAWEEVMRLALSVRDVTVPTHQMETVWGDPETRTMGQHVDALLKLKELRIPYRQLQEDAGYSQAQISRFGQMDREEQQSLQRLLSQFDSADEAEESESVADVLAAAEANGEL